MKKTVKTSYSDQEFRQLIREELKAVLTGEDSVIAGNDKEGFLSMDQAAEYLKISKSKIYKHTMDNTIPFKKNGRRLLFKKSELADWINKNVG